MRKGFPVTLIILLVAFGVFGLLVIKIAPAYLSSSLSAKLNVPVKVEGLSISLNHITIKGLKIDNIEKSILPTAFSAQSIQIKAPLFHFFKKDVVIDQIVIDNIYIGLEFDDIKSEKGNWTRLIENFYSKMDDHIETESQRTVTINKITLRTIQAQVVYKTNPEKVHTFPVVASEEFTDIKSEGGLPVDQITNSVLGKMLMSLFVRENLKNMYQEFLNPKNVIKKLISPFKLFLQ